MNILAVIFIASFLTCFFAQAYMAWKVFTLYRVLGDQKKFISFYDLSVWTLYSSAWANWRLGPQVNDFKNLPANLLERLPLVRRQTRPAKIVFCSAWAICVAVFLSGFFLR
jgi:hypothetical protein